MAVLAFRARCKQQREQGQPEALNTQPIDMDAATLTASYSDPVAVSPQQVFRAAEAPDADTGRADQMLNTPTNTWAASDEGCPCGHLKGTP